MAEVVDERQARLLLPFAVGQLPREVGKAQEYWQAGRSEVEQIFAHTTVVWVDLGNWDLNTLRAPHVQLSRYGSG